MTSTYGKINASLTGCTLLDDDGETCGQPGMPGLPLGVCQLHALMITRAVMKLAGITVEER
ncbi:MAG TPA: hypothetical protein VFG33_00055 [Kribbella sp.]|uniref:hypothetical protein n=1 Tax=Kribbella sp. TaxID=1871183 RepID=UPI002D796FD8|nr:hypothetical protein [Kribbella sp.]HET6291722.1 hypothetical protein [Kribbella sp.]